MAKTIPFVKLQSTQEAVDFYEKYPNAFRLLTQIAFRVRWYDVTARDNPHLNLNRGDALTGDLKNLHLSERQYRDAKTACQKLGHATFRGTNKGTIATITSTTIYDCSKFIKGDQTDSQTDSQTATNIELENIKSLQEGVEKRACDGFPEKVQWREAYQSLITCHQLAHLSPEQFVEALKFARPKDLTEAVRLCVMDASVQLNEVQYPRGFIQRYFSRQCDIESGKNEKKYTAPNRPGGSSRYGGADDCRIGADRLGIKT